MIGVEIGVFKGDNAENLLRYLNIEKLYLIDSYEKMYIKEKDLLPSYSTISDIVFYEPGFSGIVIDWEKCYEIAKDNLKNFNDKIIFIRKKSEDAFDDIPDGIDFIYIDGDHRYDCVRKEIELYFPKLKKGGIIAGDDFNAEYNGVAKAVLEFSSKNNLKIKGIGQHWWVVK